MKKVDPKQSLPKLEEEILKYWEANKIFEKSVANPPADGAPMGEYVFYDGPPFATGTPHYGHIVGQTLKDVVPRYWTMRGYRVVRKWGWDCHGLPIENIAEKELGVRHKKDIEAMGVAKFNEFCRSKVLGYTEEWKKITTRLGRWADRDHAYKTMDLSYMESVWWVFKQLWDKGLIYESYRIMHVCTRCETTLSQSEVSEGYANVKDLSATVKFELVDEPGTFVLAWTTTPWTLPGNVALAIKLDAEYLVVALENNESKMSLKKGERIIFLNNREVRYSIFGEGYKEIHFTEGDKDGSVPAKDYLFKRQPDAYQTKSGNLFRVVNIVTGENLLGRRYRPPFDSYSQDETLKNHENGWKICTADFVNTEDGTGVVHIAPAFGEEDFQLHQKEKLPFVQHVKMDGTVASEVQELAGENVVTRIDNKPGNIKEVDLKVRKILEERGLLFSKENYPHSYPHCWRCDTPLINYATSSWFVKVTAVKERALENAKQIEWSPEHIKAGRFGKWLEGARDWSISRQRFWASVMPVWKCEGCSEVRVFGSVKELEVVSGAVIADLHKHVVDEITFPCEQCNKTMRRIPDVLDTWFDSGSMPYAQNHYPFENKETFEANFPAQFIAEGVDQTRAWFYYLHVLGTALFDKPAFQHAIVNGIVQAEDGKKMSKRLQNYPDPMVIFDTYGADAMRLYLLLSPVVSAENINFSEKEIGELSRNVFRMLWNSYSFFAMYAEIDGWKPEEYGSFCKDNRLDGNILDRWILGELNTLKGTVNHHMEHYQMQLATYWFRSFVDQLSNWYIRQSRSRFWKSDDTKDKMSAFETLHYVLVELAKLMAPFTPFISEEIYRNLMMGVPGAKESVHLEAYPQLEKGIGLVAEMSLIQDIVSMGLKARAKHKIKVRQPLSMMLIKTESLGVSWSFVYDILNRELNVKRVFFLMGKHGEYGTHEITSNPMMDSRLLDDREAEVVNRHFSSDSSVSEESDEVQLSLDLNITPELKLEGDAREVVRFVQELRKEAGYEVENRIEVWYKGGAEIFAAHGEMIAHEVLAPHLPQPTEAEPLAFDIRKELEFDGRVIAVWLKKISR